MDENRLKDINNLSPRLGEASDRSTPPSKQHSLARVPAVPWLIVVLLLAAVAWLGWRAFGPEEEGDIVGSAILAFEKQNELTVFSSRFEVVAESTSRPSIGPLPIDVLESRQAMIVPATVEYRLDLSGVDREAFAWDAEQQTLDVVLPELEVSTPNIDEAAARYFTDGLYVSRDASVSLSRSNSAIAERRAREFATNPEVLNLARVAAKEAIRQNLAIPLEVAGFGDVTVNVRFDGERASQ